jgi:uncharacterized protein YqjF (DUF2071 family)
MAIANTNLNLGGEAAAPVARRAYLRAGWYHLAMLNYPADAAVLQPFVPAGTEIDTWNGRPYLSVVGFLMLNTRVRGIAIPCHRNFEEVNLRMYVRRKSAAGWQRGVVFIKEIVPRWMIAYVARRVYNENYVAMPMRHQIVLPTAAQTAGLVQFEWSHHGRWHSLSAEIAGDPTALAPGSEEQFITEHYWGYCRQRDGSTLEYRVEHPPWRVWTATKARLDCDVAAIYGAQFAGCLHGTPTSAFVAEGSAVAVGHGVRLVD